MREDDDRGLAVQDGVDYRKRDRALSLFNKERRLLPSINRQSRLFSPMPWRA
jgi:hypothetical protein